MKKLLIIAILCLPMYITAQDRSGVPSKGKQTTSYSPNGSVAYDYAVLKVIGQGESLKFIATRFKAGEEDGFVIGVYSSLLKGLHLLGQEGYELILVEEVKNSKEDVKKEYVLMKEVPKRSPGMSKKRN